jgi:hypothetical protein
MKKKKKKYNENGEEGDKPGNTWRPMNGGVGERWCEATSCSFWNLQSKREKERVGVPQGPGNLGLGLRPKKKKKKSF